MVQNASYTCPCHISRSGDSVYNCTLVSLHFCSNIISKQLLFTFGICSREGIGFRGSSVYVLKCLSIWSSPNWITLRVHQHSSPSISIQETAYEIQFNVFFFRKLATAQQHATVTLDWRVYKEELGRVEAFSAFSSSS
jgi:hypothetical protein